MTTEVQNMMPLDNWSTPYWLLTDEDDGQCPWCGQECDCEIESKYPDSDAYRDMIVDQKLGI